MAKADDRRRYPRLDRKFVVKFRVVGGPMPKDIADRLGQVCNVSKGGLRLSSKREILPGTIVRLEIPDNALGSAKSLTGRVCWENLEGAGGDCNLGLMFVRVTEKSSEEDRRRAPRTNRKFILKVRCPTPGLFHEELTRGAMLLNLSISGLEISTNRDYAPGTILEMNFPESPLGAPKTVRGKVVWTRPAAEAAGKFEIGAEFVRAGGR